MIPFAVDEQTKKRCVDNKVIDRIEIHLTWNFYPFVFIPFFPQFNQLARRSVLFEIDKYIKEVFVLFCKHSGYN